MAEANARKRRLCTSAQNAVQLQRRVLININSWPTAFLSNGKVFFGRVHRNRSDSTLVSRVKHLLVFGKVVVDRIRDTRCINNGVPVENLSIISLVAVMPEKAIEFDDALGNRTFGMSFLLVIFGVKEVLRHLR